jgi:hypothetical protein
VYEDPRIVVDRCEKALQGKILRRYPKHPLPAITLAALLH